MRSNTKIYLDANQVFRVVGRDEAKRLYPHFCSIAQQESWKLLLSDVLIIEQLQGVDSGADQASVQKELERLEALSLSWVCLGNLESSELDTAFKNHRDTDTYKAIDPIRDSYAEVILEALQNQELYKTMSNMTLTNAVLGSYEMGSVSERHEHWSGELEQARARFQTLLEKETSKQKARKRFFVETVINHCQNLTNNSNEVSGFAEELWRRPEVCPGFRLNFETTFALLEDPKANWSKRNFYDRKHSIILPYCDIFVTQDSGLLHAISVFDNRVGRQHNLPPYSARCFRKIEEVPAWGAPD